MSIVSLVQVSVSLLAVAKHPGDLLGTNFSTVLEEFHGKLFMGND